MEGFQFGDPNVDRSTDLFSLASKNWKIIISSKIYKIFQISHCKKTFSHNLRQVRYMLFFNGCDDFDD